MRRPISGLVMDRKSSSAIARAADASTRLLAPPAGDSSKSDAKDGKRLSRGLWSTALRDTLGSTDASRAPPSRAKDRFMARDARGAANT